MSNLMSVKCKFTRQLENGCFKRVSEEYIFSAMTFSEAETRTYEELGAIIRGEFQITAIKPVVIHDIFHYEDSEVWYACKIKFDSESEEGDKKKKVSQNFLVSAHSVKDATERLKESLNGLMVDYVITGVVVSPIIDIFPYREQLDKEISRRPLEEQTTGISLGDLPTTSETRTSGIASTAPSEEDAPVNSEDLPKHSDN